MGKTVREGATNQLPIKKRSKCTTSTMSDENDEQENDSVSSEDEEMEESSLTFADHKENGNASYKRKDYRDAIDNYTLAIDAATKEDDEEEPVVVPGTMLASVYSNRAAAHQMLLMHEKALEDCNGATKADPTFLKAHWRKARVLTTLGRLNDAIKAYSMGLIHDPNDAKIVQEREDAKKLQHRFDLAVELLSKEDTSSTKKNSRQALAQIDVVLAHCPNWYEAELLQLKAKVRVGGSKNIDGAYALSTRLLRRSTSSSGTANHSALLLARAECLFYQGSMDDAMKHLKQILGGDPDNKEAFRMVKLIRNLKKQKELADDAYKSRKYEDAVQLYTATLDACPKDNASLRSKLFFNRAACQNALRNHEECVADCTSALDLNPDYTKALLRRAASNLLIGGKDECQRGVNDYEKAYELVKTEQEERDIKEKLQSAKIQLKRAGRKDLYKTLGINRDATENEIKKAYRKLAMKLHPDRQANATPEEKEQAEAKFREVNLAHEILSDPQKRTRYDQGVDEQEIDDPNARPGGHSHGGGGGFGGMDQEMLFQMFMQQQMGGGSRRGRGGGGGGFHFG